VGKARRNQTGQAPDRRPEAGFVVRRMVAAFGAGTMSAGALERAVELAERLGAELEMLFVEDLALLQWAELPFMRQISLLGLSAPPLSRQDLELQFRALAVEAQRRLSSAAAPRRLRWSFRIARGQVAGELVAAAAHTDLLVLGSLSRPIARGALLEPSVRALIGIVRAPILLVRPEQPPGGPVHVVLEAAENVRRSPPVIPTALE